VTGFKRVDHTAIVVADLDEAIARWQVLTGAHLTMRESVEHQRVEIAMLALGDTSLELIRPLDTDSGVARFLAKHGESLHHVAFEVEDLSQTMGEFRRGGMQLVDPRPRKGAHGSIIFLHPRSTGGVLVELIEKDGKDRGQ
jgi:methylmalonyl-CoA/ethylmalonyl-CoA epimerase